MKLRYRALIQVDLWRPRKSLALLGMLALFWASSAFAETITWTGSCGDGNWHTCCFYGGFSFKKNNWSYEPVPAPACPLLPGPDDDVDFGAANVTFKDGNASIKSLTGSGIFTLGGGSFGKLTVSADATFSGLLKMRDSGSFAGGLGKANAGMSLEAIISQGVSRGVLEVSGTSNWTGTGSLQISGGGTFRNKAGATFNAQNSGSVASGTGGGTFHNQGEFKKGAGAGKLRVRSGVSFDNSGTVTVPSGTLSLEGGGASSGTFQIDPGALLDFAGGSHALDSGSSVQGGGDVNFSGGTVSVVGAWPLTGLTMVSGGTVNWDQPYGVDIKKVWLFGGTFRAAGDVYVADGFTWQGGSITGPGATHVWPGRLILTGFSDKNLLEGTTLNNYSAAATWEGDGKLNIYPSAVFNNRHEGTLEIKNDSTIDCPAELDPGTFRNEGTLVKSAGPGTTLVRTKFVNDGGTLDIRSGRIELDLNGSGEFKGAGTLMLAAGTELLVSTRCEVTGGALSASGDGGVRIKLLGELETSPGATATFALNGAGFQIDGGFVGGEGTLETSRLASWTEGIIVGSKGLLNSGYLEISGTAEKKLLGGKLSNSGTVTHVGGDIIVAATVETFSVVENLPGASYDLQGNAGCTVAGDRFDGFIRNQGTFSKSEGGASRVDAQFNNVGGTVESRSGVLKLAGGGLSTGGTWNVVDGGAIEFGGLDHTLTGTHTGSGLGALRVTAGSLIVLLGSVATFDYSGEGFQVAGGEVRGPGVVNVSGAGGWSSGTIATDGAFVNFGAFNISGDADKFLNGVFENYGTITHTGGDVYIGPGGKLTNEAGGVYIWQGGGSIISPGGGGEVKNRGTFRKSGGAATSTIGAPFVNTGVVEPQFGTLEFAGGGSSDGGTFAWTNDAVLRFTSELFTFSGSNTATGSGTAEVAYGEVSIAEGGTFAVPGALNVLGGTLSGKGTVDAFLNNSGGEVSPGGDGTGRLTVDGDYAQGAGGWLKIEIAGAADYGQLAVIESASLGGTLQINVEGSFVPSAGDEFVILTYASRSGEFADTSISGLGGITFDFDVAYNSTNVTLRVTGVHAPPSTVGVAKNLPDGWPANLPNLVVSAVFPESFYGQQIDRASGIRITSSDALPSLGQQIDVQGRLDGSGPNLTLQESAWTVDAAPPAPPAPLMVTGQQLGGGPFGLQRGVKDGVGLSNVGLLVGTSGKVTYKDPSGAFAYVNDGSDESDGNSLGIGGSTVLGVRVLWPAGVTLPALGEFVTLTGVSVGEIVNGQVVRALRVRVGSVGGD